MASLRLIEKAAKKTVDALDPKLAKGATKEDLDAVESFGEAEMSAFFEGLNIQSAARATEDADKKLVDSFNGTLLQEELSGMTPEGARIEGEDIYKGLVDDLEYSDGSYAGTLGTNTNLSEIGPLETQADTVGTIWTVANKLPAYKREDPEAVSMIYDLYRDIENGFDVPGTYLKQSVEDSSAAVDVFMKVLEEIPPVKVESPMFSGTNRYPDATQYSGKNREHTDYIIENWGTLKNKDPEQREEAIRTIGTRLMMRAQNEILNNRRFHPDLVLSGGARENFAKWLGKGSRRDSEGNPIVVFRTGSKIKKSQGGFPMAFGGGSEFSAHFGGVDAALDSFSARGGNNTMLRGFTFGSSNPKSVDIYYIKFKRDIEIPDVGNFNPVAVRGALLGTKEVGDNPALKKSLDGMKITIESEEDLVDWSERIKVALEEHGYDAISYINLAEATGSRSYLPFRPNQVKSIRNFGSFDPNVDNVMRAMVGPAVVGAGAAATAVPENMEEEL